MSRLNSLFSILLFCFACYTSAKDISQDLTMPYKVEVVYDARTNLGEGPHWDEETQSLYMVDLDQGTLMRYDYNQNKTYRAKVEGEDFASFIIPIEGQKNKFAVGCRRNVCIVNWDGISRCAKVEKTLFSVQDDDKFELNRFNDAKCDPRGRLFAGTMLSTEECFVKRTGEFYKWEKSGKIEVIKSNVAISNGLCWNEKLKKFYYIDTCDHDVKEYDYNVTTGEVKNPRVLVDLNNEDANELVYPDGMTIDSEGNLYVALYEGSGVYKIDSTGKVLEKINTPCKHITSVCFGGPNLDELFVTSCAKADSSESAGQTFKITGLGVKGLPMNKLQL